MLFPPTALERAMQIRDVLIRAMNKEYSWLRAAEILGITPRGLRRLRQRMEQFGYQGLVDTRRGRPSPRRTPVAELERILELYRERYSGFNARHFFQTVRREHGVQAVVHLRKAAAAVSGADQEASVTRTTPQEAREEASLRPDAAPGRQPSRLAGAGAGGKADADPGRGRRDLAAALRAAVARGDLPGGDDGATGRGAEHGIPESLYTDRAGWAFETPKAGGKVSKTNLTQVGEALARLGIEHIPSYSPQARGRSERMNRTLQGRLVNELGWRESRRPRLPITTCASAIYPLTTRSSPSRRRIRRVPSWSSAASIWTTSSSSRRCVRSARTTPSASKACAPDRQAGRTPHVRGAGCAGAPPPRWRLHRSVAGPRCSAAYDADGRLTPARDSADAPGCRRSDATDSGRLQGRPGDQHLPAIGLDGTRECRPPVASGSLRPALLPLGQLRNPSESGQITCQNRADRSLVINRNSGRARGAGPGGRLAVPPGGAGRTESHRTGTQATAAADGLR